MSNQHYWPSMTDYQEALQSPKHAFTSSQLRSGAVMENKLGLPRPICGTFASVYQLSSGSRSWAVKCFLRNTSDLHERYAKISKHLRQHLHLKYFVEFEYLEKEIRVRGELFPLVKMEWIDATQLNTFVEENLSKPRVLEQLSTQWDRLLSDLNQAKIAHGDLQHGNVLVRPNGDIRLIDYDGMWVPALEGQGSNETGHPDFQNPRRTQRDFDLDTDKFSAAVIQIAITALRLNPSLWQKYNNGDNLLFRRGDFMKSGSSLLFSDLRALRNSKINQQLDFIIDICQRRRRASNNGNRQARRGRAGNGSHVLRNEPASHPGSWINDHVGMDDEAATSQVRGPRSHTPSARGSAAPAPPPERDRGGLVRAIGRFFRS
jgi:serine/threonine protein kinase